MFDGKINGFLVQIFTTKTNPCKYTMIHRYEPIHIAQCRCFPLVIKRGDGKSWKIWSSMIFP